MNAKMRTWEEVATSLAERLWDRSAGCEHMVHDMHQNPDCPACQDRVLISEFNTLKMQRNPTTSGRFLSKPVTIREEPSEEELKALAAAKDFVSVLRNKTMSELQAMCEERGIPVIATDNRRSLTRELIDDAKRRLKA